MPWIDCRGRDLVVGDAVMLTRRVEVKQPNGHHYVRGDVRRKDADGTWKDVKGRIKVDYRHTGRVIAKFNNADKPVLVIERIDDVGTIEPGAVRPRGVDSVPLEVLDWKSSRLQRHTAHGPEIRIEVEGRHYLREIIRKAAGWDDGAHAAVSRLALCVRRDDLDEAETSGVLPRSIGIENAVQILEGEHPFSEAAVRQLTGRMPMPEIQPIEPPPPKPESTFPDPDDGRRMIIIGRRLSYVQPADPSDPEVAAILAAMPDAEVRILTHPTDADMIRLRRHFAPKASEAIGEAPKTGGSDANGEETVNYVDTPNDE